MGETIQLHHVSVKKITCASEHRKSPMSMLRVTLSAFRIMSQSTPGSAPMFQMILAAKAVVTSMLD